MATTGEAVRPPRTTPPSGAVPGESNRDESIDEVPMFRKRRVIIPLALLLLAAMGGDGTGTSTSAAT